MKYIVHDDQFCKIYYVLSLLYIEVILPQLDNSLNTLSISFSLPNTLLFPLFTAGNVLKLVLLQRKWWIIYIVKSRSTLLKSYIRINHTVMRLLLITYLFSTLSGKLIPEKSPRRLISTFVPLVPNVGKANVPWSLLNPKLKNKENCNW